VGLLNEDVNEWLMRYRFACEVGGGGTARGPLPAQRSPDSRCVWDLPSEIIPGSLYLGSRAAARDWAPAALRITHVVDLCGEAPADAPAACPERSPENRVYLRRPCRDTPNFPLCNYLAEICTFVDDARRSGGRVLVHCALGVSRSAAAVVAYLMRAGRCSYRDAAAHVAKCRPAVDPNPGFVQQLLALEATLGIDAARPRDCATLFGSA
jgi:hypothetical protein